MGDYLEIKDNSEALGKASIGSLLFKLSAPAIIAQIVNMLYNLVDRIYIGHIPEEGAKALTGIGLTIPIIMLTSAFSSLIGMGGAPRASIKMGEGKNDEAENILGNSVTSLIVISIVMSSIIYIFREELLYVFGASDVTINYAIKYINIYLLGTIFVQFSLGLNPFISAQGFAKTSMITVVIGAILNIILDPIFIYFFEMGIAGAALATIISQAVSCLWVLRFLTSKKSTLRIKKNYLKIKKEVLIPVMALGLSPFIMQSTESLLNIVFNSSLQKYGGDIYVGAMTILSTIMQIIIFPLTGLTQGAQPIIGYNFGAKNFDRVKKTFKILMIGSVIFTGLFWLIVLLKPELLIMIFTKDTELINMTRKYMPIYLGAIIVMGAQVACQQTFLSLGQAKISIFLTVFRKLILLIPFIYILPRFFNEKVFAVFLAEPISDVIAALTTVITFSIAFKKIIKEKEKRC